MSNLGSLALKKTNEQQIPYNKLTKVSFNEKDLYNCFGKTCLSYQNGVFTNKSNKRLVLNISTFVSWKLGEDSRGRFGLNITTNKQNVSETSLSFSTSPATLPIKLSTSVSTSLCPNDSFSIEVINLSKDEVPLIVNNGYISIIKIN
jgi:hypothetical protein